MNELNERRMHYREACALELAHALVHVAELRLHLRVRRNDVSYWC
jgi:hypothetical protein